MYDKPSLVVARESITAIKFKHNPYTFNVVYFMKLLFRILRKETCKFRETLEWYSRAFELSKIPPVKHQTVIKNGRVSVTRNCVECREKNNNFRFSTIVIKVRIMGSILFDNVKKLDLFQIISIIKNEYKTSVNQRRQRSIGNLRYSFMTYPSVDIVDKRV